MMMMMVIIVKMERMVIKTMAKMCKIEPMVTQKKEKERNGDLNWVGNNSKIHLDSLLLKELKMMKREKIGKKVLKNLKILNVKKIVELTQLLLKAKNKKTICLVYLLENLTSPKLITNIMIIQMDFNSLNLELHLLGPLQALIGETMVLLLQ